MIVQIYEIQTPGEARAMIDLGVDHIGSVLVSAEHWQDAAIKKTVATVQAAGRKSSLIPLFCDPDRIAQVIGFYRPDIIHFCDALPMDVDGPEMTAIVERQKRLRNQFPEIAIMRSIPIARPAWREQVPSLAMAARLELYSDWFLTDTILFQDQGTGLDDQPVNGFVGITGQPCDWAIARSLVQSSRIPVILAGGIGPLNVEEGILQVQPAGVDSCTLTNAVDASGQTIRFKKNQDKVAEMVSAARVASYKKALSASL
jgi:phosphoribosylanthranilate isomerase